MLSKTSKAYIQIRDSLVHVLEGTVVSIDPSIGSYSSMPGYAIYRAGVLVESGILEIDPEGSVPARLQRLAYLVRKLYAEWNPDVCVYEDIPSQHYGAKGNANSHSSLLKAVGAILSISGPDRHIGILPVSWKKMTRSTYVKGDEQDAIEIGWICVQEARRIQQEDSPKRKNRKKEEKEE